LNWNGLPVLVTGAGGFIGSHLVEALVAEGAAVRAFVHYNSRNDPGLLAMVPDEATREIEIIPGDLLDPLAVQHAVAGSQIVFHLGAQISIPYSYRHPFEVAETNLMGTLNVLQACREDGVRRLVHTSSSEVYGTAIQVPIDEQHPLQGQSPYSASKIGADKLAESFYCAYDLPVVTVRPFNTYGPRQSDRAVVPTIIAQAMREEVVQLGNLEARRDLTYVSDTVDGFLKAASAEAVEGQTYNLGAGHEIAIGDLAALIFLLMGSEIKVEIDPARLRPDRSEVDRLLSDAGKAKEELGWEPQVSMEHGLQQTIHWISDHLDLYAGNGYRF
jgi:dTDP-glucose 4,6-dehydratase